MLHTKPWILVEYFNEVPYVQTPVLSWLFCCIFVAEIFGKTMIFIGEPPNFGLVNPVRPSQGRTVTGSQWCAGCGAVGSFCWDLGMGQGPGAVSKIAVIAGMIYPHLDPPLGSSILTHSHVS